jgi:hypothetical protein
MYGRVTSRTVQQGFNRLKSHVVGAYQQGRHWAGLLDSAIHVGRRAYGAVKPLLDQSATGKRVNNVANSALSSYDTLRGDVLSAHDKTHSLLGSLRKAVPEIGL